MMFRFALLFILLAIPTSARAQITTNDKVFNTLIGTYVTANAADSVITAYCLGQGTCKEVGPLMRPMMKHLGVVPSLTIRGALSTTITYVLIKQHKKSPRLVFWTTLAMTSVKVAYDIHAYRLVGKDRHR